MSFDVEDIRKLTTDMTSKLDACDNGKGMECGSLDQSLRQYARTCCDFVAHLRQWAQDVFSGRMAFDAQVEDEWLDGGRHLYHRALTLWERTAKAGVPSYGLPEHRAFEASLQQLQRMLTEWVSPKLSVAPSARNSLSPEIIAEAKRRIAQFPPLAESWAPEDLAQRVRNRKSKTVERGGGSYRCSRFRDLGMEAIMLKEVFPKGRFFPPATEAVIASAEASLGVRFPDQLRRLYLECDGFREDRANAKYLLSLVEEDFIGSLITITRTMWTEFEVPNLKPFVFFGVASGGESWGINWQRPDQVIAYHHHMEREYEVVGSDIISVWQADYAQYEAFAVPATRIEGMWRQCSSCSEAWEEDVQIRVARWPACGELTALDPPASGSA